MLPDVTHIQLHNAQKYTDSAGSCELQALIMINIGRFNVV